MRTHQLMRFPGAVRRDAAIEVWMHEYSGELGAIAQRWFQVLRNCGDDVRELLHDGHPTACVADAAFAYVNAFTAHVHVGFFRGAELADPEQLLEGTGKFMRHVKLRPESQVDAAALVKLIETAYADMKKRLTTGSFARALDAADDPRAHSNKKGGMMKESKAKGTSRPEKPRKSTAPRAGAKSRPDTSEPAPVKLLSGGNPQIAKADGDAPVQAYIAAMPGWKSDLGRRLDAVIVCNVPSVRKAVRWNSPFYGIEGQGWFLSFHVLTRYVKVTFFAGTSLQPIPPGGTLKSKEARWIDIYEDDELDEAQFAAWVKQAAALPGWIP